MRPVAESLANVSTIVGVVTRPDAPKGRGKAMQPPPLKVWAASRGVQVLQPADLRADVFLKPLRGMQADLVLTAAYGRVLPAEVLSIPRLGCVNLHFSLLPKFRGAAPVARALLAGEQETGVTAFLMRERVDAGEILEQVRHPIAQSDTAGSLMSALADAAARMVPALVSRAESGPLNGDPQDDRQASEAPRIRPEEARIDWTEPASRVLNRIRAMSPDPGAFTVARGLRLVILEAELATRSGAESPAYPNAVAASPGAILSLEPRRGLVVECGQDEILLTKLQRAGRPVMSADEFWRGIRWEPGVVLGGE